MTAFATDLGDPIRRSFQKIGTSTNKFFGAESRSPNSNRPPRIWVVEEEYAHVMGILEPSAATKTRVELAGPSTAIQSIIDAIEPDQENPVWHLEEMNLPPGSYFPRIARPHHQHPGDFPTPFSPSQFGHERASAATQIALLSERLRTCFQVVSPVEPNFGVHGGEFRNILLLAATELEAQWKAILRANNYSSNVSHQRWSTNDYVKLEAALRLADFAIEFPEFPWIEPLSPFRAWDPESPTSSLGWYEAYNKVKHDREQNAEYATLINALEAVAAVVIIGVAQFGIQFIRLSTRWRDLFQIKQYPRWSIGDTHGRFYLPTATSVDTAAGEAIDYPF